MGTATETEVKIRLRSPESFPALVARAGFVVHRARVFESNTLYDDESRSLRTRGCLLRLREVGGRVVLTWKGPAECGKHKSREELETVVDSADTFGLILNRLGLAAMFRYEKFRTEYKRPEESGLITLDETPVGWFVELEGAPDWIDQTAAELGFAESEYLTASYGALYLEYCAELRLEPTHMIFGQHLSGA